MKELNKTNIFDIKDFDNYFIDENGNVYKKLNPGIKKDGYKRIVLTDKNGLKKDFAVHRIVCETFLDNPLNKEQVNHIDFNRTNNNILNLEWVTRYENMQHLYRNNKRYKVKDSPAFNEELKNKIINEVGTVRFIAKKYNVSYPYVCNLRKYGTYKKPKNKK